MYNDRYITKEEMTFRVQQNNLVSNHNIAISKCNNEFQRWWWQCDRSKMPPRARQSIVRSSIEWLSALKDLIKTERANRFLTIRTAWSTKTLLPDTLLNVSDSDNKSTSQVMYCYWYVTKTGLGCHTLRYIIDTLLQCDSELQTSIMNTI